jgi:hypothetical protein
MNRIPNELDLSPIIGEFTTQFGIGKYDFQFSLGNVSFSVWSEIYISRDGKLLGTWRPDEWPSSEFINLINIKVESFEIPNDREIIIRFENKYEVRIVDNSDQYESMQIRIKHKQGQDEWWII